MFMIPLIVALRPLPPTEDSLAFSSDHSDLEINPALIYQLHNQTSTVNEPAQDARDWWTRLKEWFKLRF